MGKIHGGVRYGGGCRSADAGNVSAQILLPTGTRLDL